MPFIICRFAAKHMHLLYNLLIIHWILPLYLERQQLQQQRLHRHRTYSFSHHSEDTTRIHNQLWDRLSIQSQHRHLYLQQHLLIMLLPWYIHQWVIPAHKIQIHLSSNLRDQFNKVHHHQRYSSLCHRRQRYSSLCHLHQLKEVSFLKLFQIHWHR